MGVQCRRIALVLGLGTLSFASAAEFEDFARVVNVTPQYEQVNYPRQECVNEYVPVQRQTQRGIGGSIVGGVAGGILGNQIGGGNGKTAATAVGAIAGAIVGDRIENNSAGTYTEQQVVQRCRTVDNWQTRNNGYTVTYEYRGFAHTTVMPQHPGDRLPVRVSVSPRM